MSLARKTVTGIAWAFAASALARLAWLAALAVLARLLAPEQFGLFAFGLVFIAYVETVGDLGVGTALIHWPERRDEAARVTFRFNLATGLFWFAVAQLAAPWVAAFFHHPEGEPVIRWLAVGFLLRAAGNTHDALCQKEMRFRARLLPEAALALGKGAVAVGLALAGFGVWSLVWGQLAGLLLQTAALWWVVPWRPGGVWPRQLVAPMLRYGRGIVAVNVLAAVVHHADLVVVGRMLGATALGFYQMAAKVPEATVTIAIWVVSRVLFAAFSRLHAEGEGLAEGYLAALGWISLLTLPAATGLVAVAEPLVVTLFGDDWRPAIPILRALAVYLGLRSLGTHAGDVLKASGRTGLLAALAVGRAIVLLPLLVAAGRVSAAAVAWALAAVTLVAAVVSLAVVSRLLGVPLARTLARLGTAGAASALMAAALFVWVVSGVDAGWPPAAALAVRVGLGALVYAGAVFALDPRVVGRARDGLARHAEPAAADPMPGGVDR